MIPADVLRIMNELYTFTAEDLAEALEVPLGTVGGLLPGWTRERYLVRFKFQRVYLYALSERSRRIVDKLPAIDPDERVLPIWRCDHEETIVRGWIESDDIINTLYICKECGEVVRWTTQQNSYRGWVGSSNDITEHDV